MIDDEDDDNEIILDKFDRVINKLIKN